MDILQYKQQLEQKLAVVNQILADMGTEAPKRRGRKPASATVSDGRTRKRKPMSAVVKARLAAAARARWAKVKAAGKSKL